MPPHSTGKQNRSEENHRVSILAHETLSLVSFPTKEATGVLSHSVEPSRDRRYRPTADRLAGHFRY